MKIVAVTFAYHPNIEDLKDNILRYIDGVEHLIVWDNSPEDKISEKLTFEESHMSKIEFMGIGRNVGIAYAANRAVEWGIRNGYSHLLTMDQDSKWEDFPTYRKHIEQENDGRIGIFSPVYKVDGKIISWESSGLSITSGAISPLWVFEKIGLFNEYYEIENVDYEFSCRLVESGYLIKFFPDILSHRLGNPKFVSGRISFFTCNYSPYRLFHTCRNEFCMWKDCKNTRVARNYSFVKITKRFYYMAKHILLGEDDKWKKVTAICKGCLLGILYNPRKHKIRFPFEGISKNIDAQ